MKKKLLIVLLGVLCIVCLAIGLSACNVQSGGSDGSSGGGGGHTHIYGELIEEKPATCTQKGLKAHYYCEGCQKYFDEEKTEKTLTELEIAVDATAHTYGSLIDEKPSTCTEEGILKHYQCSECNKYFDEEKNEKTLTELEIAVDETAHTYGLLIDEKPSTCSATGTKAHYYCACGKYFDDKKVETTLTALTIAIDEDAHKWDGGIVTKDATCTDTGTKKFTCEYNNEHTRTEDIDIVPTAHKLGEWIEEIPATCSATGIKGHYECSVCNKYFGRDNNEIKADDLKIEINPDAHYFDGGDKCTICNVALNYTRGLKLTDRGGYYSLDGIGDAVETDIVIPCSYMGKPVTVISNSAFAGCVSITSIEIPDSVTSIGQEAFNGCTNLTSVIIGNGVTFIDKRAFMYCSSLASVTFKNINGWHVSKYDNMILSDWLTVTNPAQNATYLNSTYYDRYWRR